MVDRLYPGVYVAEVAFQAKPIDGVPTSSAHSDAAHAAARDAKLPQATAPDWTQHNQADPGVTLVQVFTWLADWWLFQAQPVPAQRTALARPGPAGCEADGSTCDMAAPDVTEPGGPN